MKGIVFIRVAKTGRFQKHFFHVKMVGVGMSEKNMLDFKHIKSHKSMHISIGWEINNDRVVNGYLLTSSDIFAFYFAN